jgi:hypothetical protein
MNTEGLTTALAKAIEGLDLTSAEGRAGVWTVLREIEAAASGLVEQMAAHLQLRRLGLRTSAAR